MQDLFRHLRIHTSDKEEIKLCYIHKIALIKEDHEEAIPFLGIEKWSTYRCPMCENVIEFDE